MSGFNQVIVLGRLGNDPDIRYTQGGVAVASLSLATSRREKQQGSEDRVEVTTWHRVKAFGKQAEIIGEHVRKGDLLFVEGRLSYWEAQGERGKLQVAEIILEHFEFTGGGRRDSGGNEGGTSRSSTTRQQQAPRGAQRAPRPTQQQPQDDFTDDDIPF